MEKISSCLRKLFDVIFLPIKSSGTLIIDQLVLIINGIHGFKTEKKLKKPSFL